MSYKENRKETKKCLNRSTGTQKVELPHVEKVIRY